MMFRLALVLSLVAFSLPAHAQNCGDLQTQVERSTCFQQWAEMAEQDLNGTYDLALNSWLGPEDKIGQQALILAQRAWVSYRTNQCTAEAQRYDGGSLQPQVYSICMANMARARTESIRTYLEPY